MTIPKINLRDLFWLVVAVALGLGWWLDHQAAAQQLADSRLWKGRANQLKWHLELTGGEVRFAEGTENIDLRYPAPVGSPLTDATMPVP